MVPWGHWGRLPPQLVSGGAGESISGDSRSTKNRGGGLSTTAAGNLISPVGREYERGEAYVHHSIRWPRRNWY